MKKRILSLTILVGMLLCSIFLVVRPGSSNTPSTSEALLGAGAKWAANGGTKTAYVDLYDNLMAYPNPSLAGGNADVYLPLKNEVLSVLEGEGFTVDTFADIPANLSQYSLVYLEAYFACEPANEPAIRSYVFNGGGVLVWQGAISYLAYYSKSSNIGQDLSSVASWFGASYFVNTGGAAYVSVANPLGASLNLGDPLVAGIGSSCVGITSMSLNSQVLAVWDDGSTFAFVHEYGQGRVYWQASQQDQTPPTQQPPGSNKALSLTLLGGFDYSVTEPAKVKVVAQLRYPITMGPISGASVTIQVFEPNDTLWVSAHMVETLNGTGIYEWESADTVANMSLPVGVYIARVTASSGIFSASDIMLFHIDPPPNSVGTAALPFYLATIVALVLGEILIVQVLLRRASTRRRERST
jgi:hypothetical protein